MVTCWPVNCCRVPAGSAYDVTALDTSAVSVPTKMSVTGNGLPGRLAAREPVATVAVTVVDWLAFPVKKVTDAPGVNAPAPLWATVMKSRGEIMAKLKVVLLVSQPTPDRSIPAATNWAAFGAGGTLASGGWLFGLLGLPKAVVKRSKRGS